MRRELKYFYAILLLVTAVLGFSQNKKIDSLKIVLSGIKPDTNKVNTLNKLAMLFKDSKTDTAIILSSQALSLTQNIKWLKGEANSERQLAVFNNVKKDIKGAILHFNNALAVCGKMITNRDGSISFAGKKIKQKTLSGLGNVYFLQADYPNAIQTYSKSLTLAEEMGDKEVTGIMCGNIANVYNSQANYQKALVYYMRDLKISEELGNKQGAGTTLGNIAILYYKEADYPKALNYHFKALKIAEELGDKLQQVVIQGNIASLYTTESNYTKALEYYAKALDIVKELGDKQTTGSIFGNMASLYYAQSDYTKALEFYFKSLKISEEFKLNQEIGRTLNNIANVYTEKGIYDKALVYYFKGLKIKEEIGDKEGVAVTLANIGRANTKLKKYKPAEEYLKKAMEMSQKIGALNLEKETHYFFCDLYEKTKQPELALANYKKYIALRDTIFSAENNEKIMRSELNHDYEKKKAVEDAEHKIAIENQKVIADEKNRIQNVVINSVAVGLCLVLIFAAFIFRSLRITRKQRDLIEIQKQQVEEQKQIAEEQKELLEIKQKAIIDSIHYAKRIQWALLTPEIYIDRKLKELEG